MSEPEIANAPAIKSGEVLSYVDEPCERYAKGLNPILKAKVLRAYLAKWPFLAADAIEQAKNLKDRDVVEMQADRKNEAAGERIAERYGCILVPGRMMTLTMLAQKFQAPTGLVYIRLWTTGEHDRLMKLE
jgi:hypothetical protein